MYIYKTIIFLLLHTCWDKSCEQRIDIKHDSGFGGLEVACWPLLPKFVGSHPAEAVGFLGQKKSSTHLPSEGK
jgi:hypothetical protein